MTFLLEKIWFLLWMLAIVAIVRWFHALSSNGDETFVLPSAEKEGSAPQGVSLSEAVAAHSENTVLRAG